MTLHDGRAARPRIGAARARGLERIAEIAEHELEARLVTDPGERREIRHAIEYSRELVQWFRTDGDE